MYIMIIYTLNTLLVKTDLNVYQMLECKGSVLFALIMKIMLLYCQIPLQACQRQAQRLGQAPGCRHVWASHKAADDN